MKTSISEYDAVPQAELPFGEKISVVDSAYLRDDSARTNAQVRGVSVAGDLVYSPSQNNVEDAEEDVQMSETAFSDDREGGLSLLQYARLNGLTTNSFDYHPLQSASIPSPPASVLMDFDPIERQADYMNEAKKLIQQCNNERWNLDKETAELLASVMALGRINELDEKVRITRMGDLKVDEPVLSSDPESELSKLRARNAVRISTQGMEPYALHTQKGESLSWSGGDLKLPSSINESIASEKLDVDKETIELLCEVMNPSLLDHWEAVEQAIDADHSRKLRREPTPLLPLSPPLSPYEASNNTRQMELTSTPDDLFAREATRVEAQLFECDNATHGIGTSSRTFGGQNTSDDIQDLTKTPTTSSPSPLRRKRLRDWKAETPLLHEEPDTSSPKRSKTVSFPNQLHTLIPAPDSDDSIMDPALARQDIDGFLTEVVAPLAQSVIDQISNEKLDELDTTLRLSVPAVDTVEPMAPWTNPGEDRTTGSNDANIAVLSQIEKEVPPDRKKWSGLSKLERLLHWTPFPSYLGKISVDEQFDDGSCERYMAELTLDGDSGNVDALLWKLEGLRLLDPHDSDDEELDTAGVQVGDEEIAIEEDLVERPPATVPTTAPEHSQFDRPPKTKLEPGRMGMQALLQKRKLELKAASKPKEGTSAEAGGPDNGPPNDRSVSTSNLAGSDLRSYLGLQGAQVLEIDRPRLQFQEKPAAASTPAVIAKASYEPSLTGSFRILPSPMLPEPKQAVSIVISSNMLANRGLVREVQAQLPNLELIERDSANLASTWEKTSNTCEADFSLSSGTGLVCTTLQKLIQKPLPGQRNFFGIRERIASVCPQFERCLVLVSGGKRDDILSANALDERDTTAISELIGFASTLESNVEVCYVAGGEAGLARWIAASIHRCFCAADDPKMLHDETMWERLLRVAGANPAAAQRILAELKRPEAVEANENSSDRCGSDGATYGLWKFVQISAEERLQRFGPLLGGERIITRVSEVIDSRWMSVGQ